MRLRQPLIINGLCSFHFPLDFFFSTKNLEDSDDWLLNNFSIKRVYDYQMISLLVFFKNLGFTIGMKYISFSSIQLESGGVPDIDSNSKTVKSYYMFKWMGCRENPIPDQDWSWCSPHLERNQPQQRKGDGKIFLASRIF